MNGLINQHTSAFSGPFAPPFTLRVILFTAVPGHYTLHADQRPQLAAVDHLPDPPRRFIIAVLEHDTELPLAAFSRIYNPPGRGNIGGQRLFS
ncbi:hypothetical protein D3C71_1937270 [compost metagenome]